MTVLDAIYRALKGYKSETAITRELGLERRAIVASNSGAESIEVVKNICTVEEDWIEAIEGGLVHIGRAIDEGRQFIRTRGEVLPIEKVKRVSKDSVEHLARHSDLVTKEHEGHDFIPDKLYVVERLSDFAVYENRFLYMLLCYLSSFVSLRYKKLISLSNVYRGYTSVDKTVAINERKLVFQLKISDERDDDPYLKANNPLSATLERISHLMKEITHYLGTPLMQEVGKEPMLKPPIAKTNVLKMNKHFKGAMVLYNFVTAYGKEGYSVEESRRTIKPVSETTADELAEVAALAAFVAYKEGLGLEKPLLYAYEQEQERRKAVDADRHSRHIAALKKRVEESGEGILEYMLELEKRNKALERDSAERDEAVKEIARLKSEADALTEQARVMGERAAAANQEIEGVIRQFSQAAEENRTAHKLEIIELTAKNARERAELVKEHERAILNNNAEHESAHELWKARLADAEEQSKKEIADMSVKAAQAKSEYETTMSKLTQEQSRTAAMCERLAAEKLDAEARHTALRIKHNYIKADEDFTSKESFGDLEAQYRSFERFFKAEWAKTKRRIRKNVLAGGNAKGDKDTADTQ